MELKQNYSTQNVLKIFSEYYIIELLFLYYISFFKLSTHKLFLHVRKNKSLIGHYFFFRGVSSIMIDRSFLQNSRWRVMQY